MEGLVILNAKAWRDAHIFEQPIQPRDGMVKKVHFAQGERRNHSAAEARVGPLHVPGRNLAGLHSLPHAGQDETFLLSERRQGGGIGRRQRPDRGRGGAIGQQGFDHLGGRVHIPAQEMPRDPFRKTVNFVEDAATKGQRNGMA